MKQNLKNNRDDRLKTGKLMTEEQRKLTITTIMAACILALFVCVLPTLIADAVFLMIIQVAMVIILGKIFKQPSLAKGLLVAMAATFIGRTLVEIIPIIGWLVSAIVGPVVTFVMGVMVARDLAERSRKELERRANAEDAAKAYAEAEYYKKAATTTFSDDSKAEDFSNE